jgi:hypothetical protein
MPTHITQADRHTLAATHGLPRPTVWDTLGLVWPVAGLALLHTVSANCPLKTIPTGFHTAAAHQLPRRLAVRDTGAAATGAP